MRVEPIKELIGCSVEVDRSRLGDPDVAVRCRELLEEYGVLVFPKIGATDEEQLLFTASLGPPSDFAKDVDGSRNGPAGMYTITLDSKINSQKEYIHGTFFWHIDGMTMHDTRLPKGSLLSARTVAPKGGDTHFSNTYAAYERLPEAMKQEIDGLYATHDLYAFLSAIVEHPTDEEVARWRSMAINDFPIVWKHASGRRSLLVGSIAHRIVGMELAAGKALIQRLQEWAVQPDFCYEHKWSEGDMVVWDNHGTMHRATPYDEASQRRLHRTSLAGAELVAA